MNFDRTIPFIGVDMALKKFDVYIGPERKWDNFSNNKSGINKFKQILNEYQDCLVIMESSGGIERLLLDELVDDFKPVLANARQVRDYAKAIGISAKTDRIDARVLAFFAEAIEQRVYTKTDARQQEIVDLYTRRLQLLGILAKEKTRLHKCAKVNLRESRALIRMLEKRIKKISNSIARLIGELKSTDERMKLLQSVPGIGPVTTFALIAFLPELGTINRQAIAMLAGLAPLNNDSGQRLGRRVIWGGRKKVRTALYMACISALKCNPVISNYYRRLRAMNKTHKIAITACMRKMIVILNAIIRDKKEWNYEKHLVL